VSGHQAPDGGRLDRTVEGRRQIVVALGPGGAATAAEIDAGLPAAVVVVIQIARGDREQCRANRRKGIQPRLSNEADQGGDTGDQQKDFSDRFHLVRPVSFSGNLTIDP